MLFWGERVPERRVVSDLSLSQNLGALWSNRPASARHSGAPPSAGPRSSVGARDTRASAHPASDAAPPSHHAHLDDHVELSEDALSAQHEPELQPRGLATPAGNDLGALPPLGSNPSPAELKAFVSKTYDQFPPFKQVYEGRLGLNKNQALAFMYADMSRESAKDSRWQMDLETGDGSSRSWGPFQAAVTNFRGGGYDASIPNRLGLPTPDISQFKNPAVSTYAGMKRLAEGTARAHEEIGPGHPPKDYLLGSLADHNTGWVSSWKIPDWQKGYGNEVLRLMSGYLEKGHLTDNKAYWTGEPL